MNTIELTEVLELVLPKELRNALSNGETVTIVPPKPKQWEPKGGELYLTDTNTVCLWKSTERGLAGRERATKELAEAAAKASRARDRLEAFRDEEWPGESGCWTVCADEGTWHIASFADHYPGLVTGRQEFAEEAARMLNSGELVL